jgi:hypothetical protein
MLVIGAIEGDLMGDVSSKKLIQRVGAWFFLLTLIVLTSSCGGGGGTSSSSANLDNLLLKSISISAPSTTAPIGLSIQLTATGNYYIGGPAGMTNLVTWSSTSNASITSSGVLQGISVGTAVVSANYNGMISTFSIPVTAAQLQTISISATTTDLAPVNFNSRAGYSQSLSATGSYTDGSSQNITNEVTWSSNNTSVATVSSGNTGGIVTGVAAGSSIIQATLSGVTASEAFTVPNVTVVEGFLNSILYSSATVTIPTLPQGNSARTIEAWINTNGQASTYQMIQSVVSYGVTNGFSEGFNLFLAHSGITATSEVPIFVAWQNDSGPAPNVSPNVADGNWHKIDVTYDGAILSMYVDNQVIFSSGTSGYGHVYANTMNTQGTVLQIGGNINDCCEYPYAGEIQQVAIWNIALTQAQIASEQNFLMTIPSVNQIVESQNLLVYFPLVLTTTDIVNGLNLNLQGGAQITQ